MIVNILYILFGFALLIYCGDRLVDGAVDVARHARLSTMVIGLTIVGFGTSMPELLVSAQSALVGNSGIAIGNVVGSNIANIGLILGFTAAFFPLPATRMMLRVDVPFMILAATAFVAVAILTDEISRTAGIIGVLTLVAYVTWQVRRSRRSRQQYEAPVKSLWVDLLIIVAAFAGMVFGADRLVVGASAVASALGVSDRVIGLTIVATGTSLPELVASVMAARKGETEMAVGNIIGSVTFNILSVIGVSAAISPIADAGLGFATDYALMVTLVALLWIALYTHRCLVRWEGAILLLIYIAYIIHLILKA